MQFSTDIGVRPVLRFHLFIRFVSLTTTVLLAFPVYIKILSFLLVQHHFLLTYLEALRPKYCSQLSVGFSSLTVKHTSLQHTLSAWVSKLTLTLSRVQHSLLLTINKIIQYCPGNRDPCPVSQKNGDQGRFLLARLSSQGSTLSTPNICICSCEIRK